MRWHVRGQRNIRGSFRRNVFRKKMKPRSVKFHLDSSLATVATTLVMFKQGSEEIRGEGEGGDIEGVGPVHSRRHVRLKNYRRYFRRGNTRSLTTPTK